jgi:hypothetical protein
MPRQVPITAKIILEKHFAAVNTGDLNLEISVTVYNLYYVAFRKGAQ